MLVHNITINNPVQHSVNPVQHIEGNTSNKINITRLKSIRESIQQHFLIQNKNGTFKIAPVAYTLYPAKDMNIITKGMNSMNKAILQGNIKMNLISINGKKEIKTAYVNQDKMTNAIINNNFNQGLELFNTYNFFHQYCYNFHYSWYGFYCAVTVNGCYTLASKAETIAYALGLGAGAAVGDLPPLAAGLALSGITMEHFANTLTLGAEEKVGCTIDCVGSPMGNVQIYDVSVNY